MKKLWSLGLGLLLGLNSASALYIPALPPNVYQRSLDEGLAIILQDSVYAQGEARTRLEEFIASHPQAQNEADLRELLERALLMIDDRHGRVTPASKSVSQLATQQSSGLLEVEGYVRGYLVGAPPAAKKVQSGDWIASKSPVSAEESATPPGANQVIYRLKRGESDLEVTLPLNTYDTEFEPQSRMLSRATGYYLMPPILDASASEEEQLGRARAYVQRQATALSALSQPLCGLIVDLRLNDGGRPLPIVQAGSFFLGSGDYIKSVGRYHGEPYSRVIGVDSAGTVADRREAGPDRTLLTLAPPADSPAPLTSTNLRLAILTSSGTASAAEILVIAAHQLPHTRIFGTRTRGATSTTLPYTLPSQNRLSMSIATYQDRQGQAYGSPIQPDEQIATDWSKFGQADDPVIQGALRWLREQGCRD